MTSDENVETVRRAYAEWNRALESGDIATVVQELYDSAAEYSPVEEREPLRGHREIVEYVAGWLDAWDEFGIEVGEIIDAGDQVVSVALLAGKAKGTGAEVSQRVYAVTELRNGKILRTREFSDRSEALSAVGLS